MGEWIRFWITAVILGFGILAFTLEVAGLFRLGFVMNRMHASGIGDSFGLGCVVFAMIDSLKLFLLILFMWLTSPVSTHFLSRIEVNTNPYIARYVRFGTDYGKKKEREG